MKGLVWKKEVINNLTKNRSDDLFELFIVKGAYFELLTEEQEDFLIELPHDIVKIVTSSYIILRDKLFGEKNGRAEYKYDNDIYNNLKKKFFDNYTYAVFSQVIYGITSANEYYIDEISNDNDYLIKILVEVFVETYNEVEEIITTEKKKINKAREKLLKQRKEETNRAKEAAKKQLEKQKNRTKNTFCKNDIEYITQEDIEDIPTKDLVFIKLDKSIFCLDKDSFKNMIKYADDQKVRGNCKPLVFGKPLDCEMFYPINIGQNVYIDEKNYKKIKKNYSDKKMFS